MSTPLASVAQAARPVVSIGPAGTILTSVLSDTVTVAEAPVPPGIAATTPAAGVPVSVMFTVTGVKLL
jgi:hypothetical protein